MIQILLDTNFIVSCVRNKIDFFEELIGYEILIPKQVISELERLGSPESNLGLAILQKHEFKKIDIDNGHVDKRIIQYVKDKPEIIVATLDKEFQNKLKNRKLIIRGKKKLEVV